MLLQKQSSWIPILGTLWFAFLASAFSPAWEKAMETVLGSDRRFPPDYDKEHPTVITVQIAVLSIDYISEATMDYSLTFILRQQWRDSRLVYNKLPKFDKLELDSRISNSVWVPDLYFINEKRAFFHDITIPNKLMYIYPDGHVFYSIRLSMVLGCNMNLEKFPFDSQICHMSMESYSYSTDHILFKWHDDPLIVEEELRPQQFSFEGGEHRDCSGKHRGTNNDTFTCIRVDFHITRKYGYHISQLYVPSLMTVGLSWVSFWLDIDSVAARISLGILTVLTMTTQTSTATMNLPEANYVKAIDLWMAMCMVFVFAALIEFACVNVHARVTLQTAPYPSDWVDVVGPPSDFLPDDYSSISKKQDAEETSPETSQVGESPVDDIIMLDVDEGKNSILSTNKLNKENKSDICSKGSVPKRFAAAKKIGSFLTSVTFGKGRKRAHQIDRVSRFAFPAIFAAFNIFYWTYYLVKG